MTRFAALSGSNVSDYAAAGKAAGDSAAKSFNIARKYSPDYGDLSKAAMVTEASKFDAAAKASAKVAQTGIKVYEQASILDSRIDQFNKSRKAGSLAAIGKIAGAGFLAATDNTKGRERPKADRQSVIDKFNANKDAINAKYDADSKAIPEFKPSVTTPSAGTAGKDVGGDSNISSSSTQPVQGVQGMSDGWQRMSRVIKTGEGTLGDRGYTTQFTGKQFSDLSRHPAQINRSGNLASDAAGAYQFLSTTYNPAAKALGITDFSRSSQEKVGKYLAQQRGMNTDTVFTDKNSFLKELDKIAPEWASMPTIATGTSYYGQGGLSPDEAWKIYSGS